MDKEYFLNAGVPPPLQFEPSPLPAWQTPAPELNCSSAQSPDCFLNPDQYTNFESALSSMVSSPAASNSAVSNDSFMIRELIGKLGNICSSGEISPLAAAYIAGGGTNSANTSRYSTPMNSPPKPNTRSTDHLVTENFPNLGNLHLPINPNLPSLSADPGFAERAAKFSCFGSRSFNGRTNQLGLNDPVLPYGSATLIGSVKISRVSSSPSLKAQENKNPAQTQMQIRAGNGSDLPEFPSSNEGSSVSEQIPNGETGLKAAGDSNSRKRKAVSRGKSNSSPLNAKVGEAENDPSSKRSKSTEGNGDVKTEEETKGTSNGSEGEGAKQSKANSKPPEPPKDYIHVRARRGQATDAHSLAERVRREKISERMKLLQDLVPGCNKVTGKALMLDEIINYVQSLQRQVEFLSMKLATVNPRLDFNMDNLLSKDAFQPNGSLPHPMYPLDSSASAFFGSEKEIPQVLSNGAVTHCSADPVDATLCRNISTQLPQVDEFGQVLPQFPTLCEDDLQSIVQMGFGQNPSRDPGFHLQSFPGSSRTSHMKIEL
ncbi:hypothetical protein NMG60_11014297 [Bertholletia excelsa]